VAFTASWGLGAMPRVQKRRRNAEYVKFLLTLEQQESQRGARRAAARAAIGRLSHSSPGTACTEPSRTREPRPQAVPAREEPEDARLPSCADDIRLFALLDLQQQSPRRSEASGWSSQASPPPVLVREALGPLLQSMRAAPAQDSPPCPSPQSWCTSDGRASEGSSYSSCAVSGDESSEVPQAESAWDYPFSRSEKERRLILLLDRERVAAKQEVRRLRKHSAAGSSQCLAPRRSTGSPRCSPHCSPQSPAVICSPESLRSRGGGSSRSCSRSSCHSGPDCDAEVPLAVSRVDYPFSRSEKRLLLARLLDQERTAAMHEARRLRERTPRTPRGNLAYLSNRC